MSAFRLFFLGLAGTALFFGGCSDVVDNQPNSIEAADKQSRPNVLLIIADDLGYTDLGVYGSEISTPNLDQLARDGLILTDFHNQAVCAPTRAALLAGTDNHNAGGGMHVYPEQKGTPGYVPGLRRDVVTFPNILSANGYRTYFAGKWHLGAEPERLPFARGFDRSMALMQGGASHYGDMRGNFAFERKGDYTLNGKPLESLPKDFYSTDYYTDFIMSAIEEGQSTGKPWFAELAYTAPHWPLHAPREYIDKYKGRYDAGYEVLRAERIERGKALGVIPANAPTYQKLDIVAPWESLSDEEKEISARKMEIYAAMVEIIDINVGRLIDYLKETEQYENTLIMFISDNGAEGAARPSGDNGEDWTFDNRLENLGLIDSHSYYGPEWAGAGVGVMRYYKSFASEGGTRGPAIIHYPSGGVAGEISDAFASVIDIAPTVLDLADVERPDSFEGRTVQNFQGRSMVPFVMGDKDAVHSDEAVFGWEVFGHRAIRQGDWKLLRLTSNSAERRQPKPMEANNWGLYNMATDPGEVNDLSAQHPEIVAKLLAAWDQYTQENNVILPSDEK